jgi:hypothetical protein
VIGFGDDIRLSGETRAILNEPLASLRNNEIGDNDHLQAVLHPVERVPVVSISHELAPVTPVMVLPSLDAILAIPPPLAVSHLQTFRRWYHNRVPLSLTDRSDKWNQLEAMLSDKTVYQSTI